MHSIAIASLLAAAATFVSAAPTPANNDPTVCAAGTGYFQSCSNGFRGCCKTDACGSSWCPDYKYGTYEPAHWTPPSKPVTPPTHIPSDPTVCKVGYYQVCSNGFKGCCKTDACGSSWCPDYKPYTYEPVHDWKRSSDPTICPAGTGYYQVCSNGFKGCCKADACGGSWCPDYKPYTYERVSTPAPAPVNTPATPINDPSVCKAGTGFYQVCANGFKGCCKTDACGSKWCPDYKPYTYEPVHWARSDDPTVCKPGTGYYQVCASGFKGCCKTDACTLGYCAA